MKNFNESKELKLYKNTKYTWIGVVFILHQSCKCHFIQLRYCSVTESTVLMTMEDTFLL